MTPKHKTTIETLMLTWVSDINQIKIYFSLFVQ